MSHPDEGRLQAYLDGEVLSEPREALDRHLHGCRECRDKLSGLDSAGRVTRTTLAQIDLPAPEADATRWAIRREWATRRSREHRRRVAVAASVVLLLSAGWAAAMLGSPLRRIWESGSDAAAVVDASPLPSGQPAGAAAQPAQAKVGVPALDGAVAVTVVDAGVGSSLEITLVDGEQATVLAPTDTRFATADGVLRVDLGGEGRAIRIEIPRSLSSEVTANGLPLFRLSDGQASYPGPEPVSVGGSTVRFEVGR